MNNAMDADRIQSMVINAKKEGKDLDLSHLMEISDDMGIDQVVWYYNNVPGKRYDIEKIYFDKYKTYQEWYEIYKASRPKDITLNMSVEMIFKKAKNIRMLLEIYDVDFNDDLIRKQALEKIIERAGDSFENWLFVYDESIYDEKLNKMALKRCLSLAKSNEEWQHVYDRSEIGSPMQFKAIQKLYGQVHLRKSEISDREVKTVAKRSQKEYNDMYEAEAFGSMKRENILINKLFAADSEAGSSSEEKPPKS